MLNGEGNPSVVVGNNKKICFSTDWASSIGFCEKGTSKCIYVYRRQLAVSAPVTTGKGVVLRQSHLPCGLLTQLYHIWGFGLCESSVVLH